MNVERFMSQREIEFRQMHGQLPTIRTKRGDTLQIAVTVLQGPIE